MPQQPFDANQWLDDNIIIDNPPNSSPHIQITYPLPSLASRPVFTSLPFRSRQMTPVQDLTLLLAPIGGLRQPHFPLSLLVPVPTDVGNVRPTDQLYQDTMLKMCSDSLHPRRCYNPHKCIPSGKIHKCIKWPEHGCNQPFLHYLWVHVLPGCPNKNPKDDQKDCGHKHITKGGIPQYSCFQLVTVAHIKSTCKKIQLTGFCWKHDGFEPTEEEKVQQEELDAENERKGIIELPGCKYGHDMRVVRMEILQEKNRLSAERSVASGNVIKGGSMIRGNAEAMSVARCM
ncbi:hypothetical protein LTR84_008648 [Exophiala bonariae]|uniref:Uncharacterized protein n=1 Tax=Exophiala bonariae TaxID=1690606 RepID=A0AAV9MXK7_9EURO|nr:hypothetical protein LTR84_008648 [Exophiala bonariae]